MAALKKSKKAGSSPAMAITLTFFVLLSIGLGVAVYFIAQGKDELRKKAVDADNAKAAFITAEKYQRFMTWDMALAAGHKLPPEYKKNYKEYRDYFYDVYNKKGIGKFFGGSEDYAKAPDFYNIWDFDTVEKNKTNLAYTEGEYVKNYQVQIAAIIAEKDKVEKALKAEIADLHKVKIAYDTVLKSEDVYWTKVLAALKTEFEKTSPALRDASAMFDTLRDKVNKAEEAKREAEKIAGEEKERLERVIAELRRDLKTALSDRPEGGAPAGGGAKDLHALVLDISTFRPLWDRPLGKITSLDLTKRMVYVQRNSRNAPFPFKKGLTFLVFAAGADEGASGVLKGSVEVVNDLSENTFACRITSFYDIDRGEINLADPAKILGIRSARNALKEGDLIFNMTFGTRVALAGVYDLNGDPAASPEEQRRQLEATIASLERKGVKVDAWIDPITGSVKGEGISAKTRFLIRGDDFEGTAGAPMGMPKGEMKEGEPKEGEMKEEGAIGDRAAVLKSSFTLLRKQAIENGLFIISRSNFNVVTGHFPPRHFGESTRLNLAPGLPAATTLAAPTFTFLARDGSKLEDFIGDWGGSGWEASFDKDGKARVNMVTDRGGITESRLVPGNLAYRGGKIMLSVEGPMPLDLVASMSVGGGVIQLEDPSGKMTPKKVTLRKR